MPAQCLMMHAENKTCDVWTCEELKGDHHSYLGLLRAAVAISLLRFPEGQHSQPLLSGCGLGQSLELGAASGGKEIGPGQPPPWSSASICDQCA